MRGRWSRPILTIAAASLCVAGTAAQKPLQSARRAAFAPVSTARHQDWRGSGANGAAAAATGGGNGPDAAGAVRGEVPAHAASEGYVLGDSAVADARASTTSKCPAAARVRRYDVAAIDVDITLNRYLDHDPEGRMYVLEQDVRRVREEEGRNAAARNGRAGGDPAVSIGLQGDAVQPLTLRVTQGECLQIRFRNALTDGHPASVHLHGAALRVASAGGGPAIATHRGP